MQLKIWRYGDMDMALENTFDFTADDLTSNAKGKLTVRQEELLKSYRRISGCGAIVALIAVIGSFGVLGAIVFFNLDSESPLPQEAVLAIGGVFGSVIVIFLVFWLWGIYRARYVRSPKVFDVTGEARPHLKKRQYHTEYYVSIGKVRFQMQSKNQYDAIQADQTYHVYYIHYPPTHIILSIELL
jgi:hypothetical protein